MQHGAIWSSWGTQRAASTDGTLRLAEYPPSRPPRYPTSNTFAANASSCLFAFCFHLQIAKSGNIPLPSVLCPVSALDKISAGYHEDALLSMLCSGAFALRRVLSGEYTLRHRQPRSSQGGLQIWPAEGTPGCLCCLQMEPLASGSLTPAMTSNRCAALTSPLKPL